MRFQGSVALGHFDKEMPDITCVIVEIIETDIILEMSMCVAMGVS